MAKDQRKKSDVVILPCKDDYAHLTFKNKQSLQWSYERNYQFVFRAFVDTYVCVDRLVASGFEQADYIGNFGGFIETGRPIDARVNGNNIFAFASGGPGYWLSRRAVEVLQRAPILGLGNDLYFACQDDVWTGRSIYKHKFLRYIDDERYFETRVDNKFKRTLAPEIWNNVISVHLSKGKGLYNAQWMHDRHAASLDRSRTIDSPDVDTQYVEPQLSDYEKQLITTTNQVKKEPTHRIIL